MLVDIRLHNTSQMAGFTKKRDLPYFLETICNCKYEHYANYAPTENILSDWRKKRITWPEYEAKYIALMTQRNAVKEFMILYDGIYDPVCLLCSEPKPTHCHRRLFAEMIAAEFTDIEISHL